MIAYHGTAIARNTTVASSTAPTPTRGARRVHPAYAPSASAGISTPRGPFVSTASAASTVAAIHGATRARGVSAAAPSTAVASYSAKHAPHTNVANTVSVSISRPQPT